MGGICSPQDACQTGADCPAGQKCVPGPRGKQCATPSCAVKAPPAANTPMLIGNAGVDPSYAVGATFHGNDFIMYPYSSQTKAFQELEVGPGPAPGQYLIYSKAGGTSPAIYAIRDVPNMSLGMVAAGGGYDPAKDPNAPWVYEGGVLSDPKKTYMLGAAPCGGATQPAACGIATHSGPAAGPYLATYDSFGCQENEFVWSFEEASA